jgi:hypothetical protein
MAANPAKPQIKNSPTGGPLRFLVARGGIEPPTQGFSILCSTDRYWPKTVTPLKKHRINHPLVLAER